MKENMDNKQTPAKDQRPANTETEERKPDSIGKNAMDMVKLACLMLSPVILLVIGAFILGTLKACAG